jgi:hypothetical protein
MKQGLLVTADGAVFRGRSIGVDGSVTGEVVFNTAMTGYQEIVTDPSYAGQVVVLTAPHIGNYGTTEYDDQSPRVHARSLVTRSMSEMASSWRSTQPLQEFLARRGVVALSDVDTRRLTRRIRDNGAMSVAVGSDVDEAELASMAAAAPSIEDLDLVSEVTTANPYFAESNEPRTGHVVAFDFGINSDIIRPMNSRGIDVSVVPAYTTAAEALALEPDAVFLSNGPGDPGPLTEPVAEIRELLASPRVRTPSTAVKEAVLPWRRFPDEDTLLGPEMRATGEVMGLGPTPAVAYAKALNGAGHAVPLEGAAFISLADRDKASGVECARLLIELGFRLYATHGTAGHLARNGLASTHVDKVGEGLYDPVRLIEEQRINLVINTPVGGKARGDGRTIRRAATRHGIPCITTAEGGLAVVQSIVAARDETIDVVSIQDLHALSGL